MRRTQQNPIGKGHLKNSLIQPPNLWRTVQTPMWPPRTPHLLRALTVGELSKLSAHTNSTGATMRPISLIPARTVMWPAPGRPRAARSLIPAPTAGAASAGFWLYTVIMNNTQENAATSAHSAASSCLVNPPSVDTNKLIARIGFVSGAAKLSTARPNCPVTCVSTLEKDHTDAPSVHKRSRN